MGNASMEGGVGDFFEYGVVEGRARIHTDQTYLRVRYEVLSRQCQLEVITARLDAGLLQTMEKLSAAALIYNLSLFHQ